MTLTKSSINFLLLLSVGSAIFFIFRGDIFIGTGFLVLSAVIDYIKLKRTAKNKY
ncbi:MAG: hypothetical protein QM734_12010 [Cyclobacteriaceae bacterium]